MNRPHPPGEILEPDPGLFLPAPEVLDWLRRTILAETGSLHNPAHVHLLQARIGVLWTNYVVSQHGILVVGSAEIPTPRGRLWVKSRQAHQLDHWFGPGLDFLITLYAPFAAEADDYTFCSLVEHELYHCGLHHYTRKGKPVFSIRGHDVEEFVGIVERYGPGAAAGETERLVEAGKRKPTVGPAQISAACGTCLVRAA